MLVLSALAPYLVVVATRFGHSYTPEGDNGTIDLRVRDVWSLHPPLVGPYSTFGWNHPGPLLFYALAIPSLLSGFAAWGTQVGGALLQGLAVAWLAWLAWRRGRLPLLAVTMVGVGLLRARDDTRRHTEPLESVRPAPVLRAVRVPGVVDRHG